MDLYGEFEWRRLVYDSTDGLRDVLARERVTLYAGFDPTAASLHVGHLLPILALARAQRLGHSPIAVVGGGTGLIGDPSGKTAERQLLASDQVVANVEAIHRQLARFLDAGSGGAAARLVNNAEWLTALGAVEFMRDVGKHFSVNAMLAKDSVRRRLESDEGISYTEFSYSLLQAFDFLTLYDRFGCTLQIGGSDQWGNITAGMDLIRRVRGGRAYGLVMPLLTTAAGAKFGKTESGSVWLDPGMSTPYEFYQFWLNSDDRDVGRYLRFFTFLDASAIADLDAALVRHPDRREPQRALAQQVTTLVHGERATQEAEAASRKLFGGDVSNMTVDELMQVFPNVPSSTTAYAADGWPILEFVLSAGLARSRGEAARLIRGGGLYVNERRITDEKSRIRPDDAIAGQMFIVRKGKRDNHLVRILRG